MFGIEKDFQNLMEQVYGPLKKTKITNMTERAQTIREAFYLTFADKRQDFIIEKLNDDAIANVLREVINQLQQSPGVIMCADVLELCEELEKL
jgi:hypothetical protein